MGNGLLRYECLDDGTYVEFDPLEVESVEPFGDAETKVWLNNNEYCIVYENVSDVSADIIRCIKQALSPAIEFVSYSGKYPSLCNGILVLKINGEIHTFNSYDYFKDTLNTETMRWSNGIYEKFWTSGGMCDYRTKRTKCERWWVDPLRLPPHLRSYANEIADVLNDNIEFGCCGGCL